MQITFLFFNSFQTVENHDAPDFQGTRNTMYRQFASVNAHLTVSEAIIYLTFVYD